MSTIFEYSVLAYKYMKDNSTTVTSKELADFGYPSSDDEIIVFNGTFNHVATELNMSHGMRNKSSTVLKSIRAVTLLRPGGPHTKSIYILNYEPTLGMLETRKNEIYSTSRKILPTINDQMMTTIALLQARVQELENRLDRHDIR